MGFFIDICDYLVANPGFILSGLLIYIFIYALSLFFSSPSPGSNPFKLLTTSPVKPHVTDQTARDKVLKQGFTTKKIPDQLDAIVIGSGIGGLVTAAILSKVGKRVLVLEQHDQAGGTCHTYIEEGFEFDTGIHYVGELHENSMLSILLNLVTDGQLQWVPLDPEFDVVGLGEQGKRKFYPIRYGTDAEWKKNILKSFPGEEKALDKFLALQMDERRSAMSGMMLKVFSKLNTRLLLATGLIKFMTKSFKLPKRTTKEVLEDVTDNKDLQAVLAYCFGDYGVQPSKSPFSVQALLMRHFARGAYYPKGGTSEIPFHIIPVIERAGGRVLVRAPVSKILTDSNGVAVGVAVKKGSEDIEVRAPLVISDAGVANTVLRLLPKEIGSKTSLYKMMKTGRIQTSLSFVSLFVGLKGTTEELGLKAQNHWIYSGNDLSQITEDYLAKTAEEAAESEAPMLFISFPSAKDPYYNERHPGKSVCLVITVANWEWFSKWTNERVKKRGPDYESLKSAFGTQLWDQTLSVFPQLKDKVEYFNVGSPVTNKYYMAFEEGEIYGLNHTLNRFADAEIVMNLRPDLEVPRLLLTGQDVFNCGLYGASLSALLTASKVLNRNLAQDLINELMERRKKK